MSSPQSHLSEASDDGHDNDDQENLESHDDGDNVGQENLGSGDDHVPDSPGDASDLPPESYCVPAGSEQDWLYRNATLLRKTSRKMVFPRDFSQGIKCSRASLSRMRSLSLIAFPATHKHWAADGTQRHNGVSLFRSRISRNKTEYMECRFSGRDTESEVEVKIDSHLVPKVDRFRYLGSVIQADGELDADVGHRVGVAWAKWRLASGVLCDPKISPRMKGKFYRSVVGPAMLYGAECWAVKKTRVRRLHAAEMRMLRWMCGKTRLDRISNEVIRRQVGMAPVEDKLREARLRWLCHVRRRDADAPVRRCERITVIRGRGRPKKNWEEVIRQDLGLLDLTEDMALDRNLWRTRIRVAG
ncbi:unnamed protein product [Cuscuta campestris]|uniref:Uncharacterized protein n=1 Tax=Cuscuta campestris TaxID=132261 RepID=A0A484LXI2_9ASTE|nr:unnamed protein product [Cuscuta campestris]